MSELYQLNQATTFGAVASFVEYDPVRKTDHANIRAALPGVLRLTSRQLRCKLL
jgi:hypothetical protein